MLENKCLARCQPNLKDFHQKPKLRYVSGDISQGHVSYNTKRRNVFPSCRLFIEKNTVHLHKNTVRLHKNTVRLHKNTFRLH